MYQFFATIDGNKNDSCVLLQMNIDVELSIAYCFVLAAKS